MKLEMKKDVIYRCIGTDFNNGILSCGFMTKPTKDHSQYNLNINYYSWFFLISGNGYYYTIDGEKIPLNPGDIVQRFPGVCHSTEIIPNGNWLEFFISFGQTTFDYLCSLNLISIDSPVKHVCYDDTIFQRFSRFLAQLKVADDKDLPFMSLQAQEIILSINSLLPLSSQGSYNCMEEACRILSSDLNKKISLEEIATSINMGYENFRKQFYKYTGTSPDRYRIEQRMKRAKLMLLSGISIKETALLTDYSDIYSFTKQFTRTFGVSPGRFIKGNVPIS